MATNRIYLKESVWDAALARIRWLYDEFAHIIVDHSGGKDSDIVLRLAVIVAEERGRLPVDALFIDQEAEWQATIDHVRVIADDPRVRMHWLQMPIRLFNATSVTDAWLRCWDPAKQSEWIRPKEPDAIHENTYGTEVFAEVFAAFQAKHFPNDPSTHIAGVRAEESPARAMGLTMYETYKGETWGKVENKKRQHYAFYPIYDWSYTDVWKAIHDNGWPYNRLYDVMYQYGVPTVQMRVSNVHHETAVRSLFYLQEVEPETWERITARLAGINSAGQLQMQFFKPRELPFMFKDWREYRDHLLENLIEDASLRERYRTLFAGGESHYEGDALRELLITHVAMLLVNDYHGTKLKTFQASHMEQSKNRGKRSGRTSDEPLSAGPDRANRRGG